MILAQASGQIRDLSWKTKPDPQAVEQEICIARAVAAGILVERHGISRRLKTKYGQVSQTHFTNKSSTIMENVAVVGNGATKRRTQRGCFQANK